MAAKPWHNKVSPDKAVVLGRTPDLQGLAILTSRAPDGSGQIRLSRQEIAVALDAMENINPHEGHRTTAASASMLKTRAALKALNEMRTPHWEAIWDAADIPTRRKEAKQLQLVTDIATEFAPGVLYSGGKSTRRQRR